MNMKRKAGANPAFQPIKYTAALPRERRPFSLFYILFAMLYCKREKDGLPALLLCVLAWSPAIEAPGLNDISIIIIIVVAVIVPGRCRHNHHLRLSTFCLFSQSAVRIMQSIPDMHAHSHFRRRDMTVILYARLQFKTTVAGSAAGEHSLSLSASRQRMRHPGDSEALFTTKGKRHSIFSHSTRCQ